ncbi:MAG: hypothetical protein WDW36_001117 [Sanguina aurantia]
MLALKLAVGDQLNEFSAGVFADANDQGTQVQCPVTGELLYDTPTSYVVEHIAPDTLSALVSGWLLEEGFTVDDIRRASGDNTISSELSDMAQLESWRRFHAKHARLQLVSANLRKQKQQYGGGGGSSGRGADPRDRKQGRRNDPRGGRGGRNDNGGGGRGGGQERYQRESGRDERDSRQEHGTDDNSRFGGTDRNEDGSSRQGGY